VVTVSDVIGALEEGGHRLTAPRRALADLVATQEGHFTADDLLDIARRRRLGLGRATIFRALDVLTELGVIERVDMPSGEHAFVACEPVHHHHVVCASCGRATWVADPGLEQVAAELGRRTGYRIASHRLELFGVCPDCQASRRDA
jgi:Fur family ferric uptake transcriptional regulator